MEKGQRNAPTLKSEDLARWSAAHIEALRFGRALRDAANVFRRYAGKLKYRPHLGVESPVGQDLPDAAAGLRETLSSVIAIADRWDEEVTWLRSVDPTMAMDDIQGGHAAAREAARLLRAALDIFDRVVLHPERAALDAPYGSSAPRRVHPGAQCTWVAERADGLARELGNVTLRKATLLLSVRRR